MIITPNILEVKGSTFSKALTSIQEEDEDSDSVDDIDVDGPTVDDEDDGDKRNK
jgi:hypothetical protein